MQQRTKYIIFAAVTILILTLLFYCAAGSGGSVNWKETYKEGEKAPYGLFILRQMMSDYAGENKVKDIEDTVFDDLPEGTEGDENYIFIGESPFYDTSDVNRLLEFVGNGNKAFIASKSIPTDLIDFLYIEECNYEFWQDYAHFSDTAVAMTFLHSALSDSGNFEIKYKNNLQTKSYQWNYIDRKYFCPENAGAVFVPMGEANFQYVNFMKAHYKRGTFYFHTNPMAFTNLQLLKERPLEYAGLTFSHLHRGNTYWDTYSRTTELFGRRRNFKISGDKQALPDEGPLDYILSQRSLAWAWYLLLGMTLLYLLFRAKRRQRVIPVLEPNTNTSLEFVSTVGYLYYQQKNHRQLALEKMKFFKTYLRDRYGMTSKNLTAERLSKISEVPFEEVKNIFDKFNIIERSDFAYEEHLIKFHLALENFYKKCK